jgi:hypothetical protein
VHEIDVEADQGVVAAEVLAPQQRQEQVVVGLPAAEPLPPAMAARRSRPLRATADRNGCQERMAYARTM